MEASSCVHFLQWALPQLQMRWPGFRKVRKQVCKRIDRRLKSLELSDIASYRTFLETHPSEWTVLDGFCRITISRFYRDRMVFERLRHVVLPNLAAAVLERGEDRLRCWSIGSASGEEAYTLNLIFYLELSARFPALNFHVVATDADEYLLERARTACYQSGSLRDLPSEWRESAFTKAGELYCLKDPFKTGIDFRQQDIRTTQPDESFHLILCRNLVFTYYEEELQQQILTRIISRLKSNGGFVIGKKEQLPGNSPNLIPWERKLGIYRKLT
jgi:chemotaxis protein methyltransferase CheR